VTDKPISTRKLIEVGIPLDIINDASSYDKMPGIGPHPKGLHHWWAGLPLPCARAILFASLVDAPESLEKRKALYEIIRQLCDKKATLNEKVFYTARQLIRDSCGDDLPILVDPFSGGGSIPLEGIRLGLGVEAVDLNPVAALKTFSQIGAISRFNSTKPIKSSVNTVGGISADLLEYGNFPSTLLKNPDGTTRDAPKSFGGSFLSCASCFNSSNLL